MQRVEVINAVITCEFSDAQGFAAADFGGAGQTQIGEDLAIGCFSIPSYARDNVVKFY